jgi:hypothetical protein
MKAVTTDERHYHWQIYLPAELMSVESSTCCALSTHCVTVISSSIIEILFYRETRLRNRVLNGGTCATISKLNYYRLKNEG